MDTATQILNAARKAFDKRGLEGLSLRDIAREVGITPMAIYRHYVNKQALIDALVLDGLEAWSRRAARLADCAPEDFMARMGDAFLDFALEQPRRFEAAFLIRTEKARRYPDDFAAGRSPAGSLLLAMITRAMKDGKLAKIDPMEMLVPIAAMSQGLVTLYRAGRIAGGEKEFRALYGRAMERLVRSFRKESPT